MAVSDEVRPARRRAADRRGRRDRHSHARRHREPDPVARRPDDPRGEPRPAEHRRDQGRRPPGLERLGRLDPDRALLPLAARGRPRRDQAARLAGLPLAPVPAGQPRRVDADAAARVRRAPVVPVPDQGPGPGRLLDGLGRARAPSRRCSRPSPTATCGSTSAKRIASQPERRFVALVGDAELDEGNVWEAIARGGAGRARQRHDDRRPQPPEPRPGRARDPHPAGRGHVRGGRLARHRGEVRAPAPGTRSRSPAARRSASGSTTWRTRTTRSSSAGRVRSCASACWRAPSRRVATTSPGTCGTSRTTTCRRSSADLGGHDPAELERAFRAADAETTRPTVIFAYTIKGWRLPFAGDSLNHSAHARRRPGRPARARPRGRPGRRLGRVRARLAGGRAGDARGAPSSATRHRAARSHRPGRAVIAMPDIRIGPAASTQQAFGDTLAALARDPEIGGRIVTAAPDVAVSTNLGGWINRAGVFSALARPGPPRRQAAAGLGAGSGRAPHRARHQRDEPVPVAEPVRAHRRAVRRAAGADRLGLRPVHRARPGRAHLRALRQARFVLVGTPSGVSSRPKVARTSRR